MKRKTTKELCVATNQVTGHSIALLREKSDFKGFYDQDYVKEKYGINKSNTTFRQNAAYVNPRVHVDIISGVPIQLVRVMVCNDDKQISIAKKMKQAYNKLFKLQNKYYSTLK